MESVQGGGWSNQMPPVSIDFVSVVCKICPREIAEKSDG
jgi:hypothetical protein